MGDYTLQKFIFLAHWKTKQNNKQRIRAHIPTRIQAGGCEEGLNPFLDSECSLGLAIPLIGLLHSEKSQLSPGGICLYSFKARSMGNCISSFCLTFSSFVFKLICHPVFILVGSLPGSLLGTGTDDSNEQKKENNLTLMRLTF